MALWGCKFLSSPATLCLGWQSAEFELPKSYLAEIPFVMEPGTRTRLGVGGFLDRQVTAGLRGPLG